LRRRDRDRADLPRPGDRLALDLVDPGQRHTGRDGGDVHLLGSRAGLEPRRGHALRVAPSADLVPLIAPVVSETVARQLAVAAGQPRTSLWQETGRRFRPPPPPMAGAG